MQAANGPDLWLPALDCRIINHFFRQGNTEAVYVLIYLRKMVVQLVRKIRGISMINVLISVIIPIYNVEKYLRRCVMAFSPRRYRNLEVILVDDGRRLAAALSVTNMRQSDDRVVVIHQKNKGAVRRPKCRHQHGKGRVSGLRGLGRLRDGRLYPAALRGGGHHRQRYGPVQVEVCHRGKPTYDPLNDTGRIDVFTGTQMMNNLYIHDGAYFVVAWNKLYHRSLF